MIHHHKPVFSGQLTAGLLNNAASVSGQAICTVLNGPLDSHFKAGSYPGAHGVLVSDVNGNYTYTPNAGDTAVSGLATGATLTDTIVLPSHYTYKGIIGPAIVITITGH